MLDSRSRGCGFDEGSVIQCLTQDRGVVGSSFTRGSAIVSLSETVYILLSTDSTLKDLS